MTDNLKDFDDVALDAMFAQVRRQQPEPSSDLMARILGDAQEVQSQHVPLAEPTRSRGFVGDVWVWLGGWGGAGGLAAVMAAGIWIGVAPPAALESLSSVIYGQNEMVSLFATNDILGTEG